MRRIELQYIQPGKPIQNSYIERFNRTYRQEILGAYLFEDLSQVKALTEEWINLYNRQRPHDSLNGLTPERFLLKYGKNMGIKTINQELNLLDKFVKQA
jgi:putative transposase